MIRDSITFYWSTVSHEYYPGAKIYHLADKSASGYGTMEIAGWLGDDIQYSINSVDIWLKNIDDVASGTRKSGDFGIGNAHWVMIVKDKVFIGCEYVDGQSVLLTTEQLISVLKAYRIFLVEREQGRYRNENDQPPPIPVEYIAEADEAIALYENLEGSYGMPY